MGFILLIYTVVAATNANVWYDWRPMGEFSTIEMCQNAGKQISKRFICVQSI